MILILTFITFIISVDAYGVCDSVLKNLKMNKHVIAKNGFNTVRNIKEYNETIGQDRLIQIFKEMKKKTRQEKRKQHWLDSGAGTGYAIYTALFERPDRFPLINFDITALVYSIPKELEFYYEIYKEIGKDRFKLFAKKKYIEDPHFNYKKIKKTDLITDIIGPVSYSDKIDRVLEIYLELSYVGGSIIILFSEKNTIDGESPEKYLRKIQGVKVSVLRGFEDAKIYELEKLSDDYSVPHLDLKDFKSETPPIREWVTKASLQ